MLLISEPAETVSQTAGKTGLNDITAVILVILGISLLIALPCARYVYKCRRLAKKKDSSALNVPDTPADAALTRRSTVSVMLFACSGYMGGRVFTFRRELIIGRDSSVCTVVYPTKVPGIDGTHCRLYVESGGVFLADIGSVTGTYLENGERVAQRFPVRLTAGSKFYIAEPENMFEVRL